MQKRKSKIILIYFFLLTILGSINNIGLSNIKFNNVENINISGLNNSDNQIVLKNLKNLNLESIFSLDERAISKIMDANTLIEKYIIF